MPAPNIMHPARQCGLYNPNAYVRGGAVEALGKVYGVNAVNKARKEASEAKARVEHYASKEVDVSYTPVTLTDEELAAYDGFIMEEEEEEEKEEPAAAEGELRESEKEREKPSPGAAGAGAGNSGGGAAAAGQGAGNDPVEKQKEKKKKKKKQTKPPPLGTAWFLNRGKELDSKRTF